MREEYNVKIIESTKELTARERIKMKDLSKAIPLDETVTPESPLVIAPADYAILGVHNEKADEKDYTKFLILDTQGNTYVTGSQSFFNSFSDIFSEMREANETDYEIEIFKKESTNYKGKHFLTCSIV